MNKCIILIILLLISFFGYGQLTEIYSEKKTPGAIQSNLYGTTLFLTTEIEDYKFVLISLNTKNDSILNKAYITVAPSICRGIEIVDNYVYILFTYNFAHSTVICKYDTSLNLIWRRDKALNLISHTLGINGELLLLGTENSDFSSPSYIYVLKDTTCNAIKQFDIDPTSIVYFHSDSDSSYKLVNTMNSYQTVNKDYLQSITFSLKDTNQKIVYHNYTGSIKSIIKVPHSNLYYFLGDIFSHEQSDFDKILKRYSSISIIEGNGQYICIDSIMNHQKFVFSKPIILHDSTIVFGIRNAVDDTKPAFIMSYDLNCKRIWSVEIPSVTNFIYTPLNFSSGKIKVYYSKRTKDNDYSIYSLVVPIPNDNG